MYGAGVNFMLPPSNVFQIQLDTLLTHSHKRTHTNFNGKLCSVRNHLCIMRKAKWWCWMNVWRRDHLSLREQASGWVSVVWVLFHWYFRFLRTFFSIWIHWRILRVEARIVFILFTSTLVCFCLSDNFSPTCICVVLYFALFRLFILALRFASLASCLQSIFQQFTWRPRFIRVFMLYCCYLCFLLQSG